MSKIERIRELKNKINILGEQIKKSEIEKAKLASKPATLSQWILGVDPTSTLEYQSLELSVITARKSLAELTRELNKLENPNTTKQKIKKASK